MSYKESFAVKTHKDGAYSIISESFKIESDSISAYLKDIGRLSFSFENQKTTDYGFAGYQGQILEDVSNTNGTEIKRQFFISSDRTICALRFAIKNTGRSRIFLSSFNPMEINKTDGLKVCGDNADAWKILRYPVHKSDIPSYYKPSVADKDFEDAAYSCVNAVPGQGATYNNLNAETRTILSGALTIIKNFRKSDKPALMMALTGTCNHFFDVYISTTQDRQRLKDLIMKCTFDDVAIDPGSETSTHWLLFASDRYEGDLINVYSEAVANIYNVKRPSKPSQTIYTTWYFYNFLIRQEYIEEEVKFIKENKLPIDVFQIDDGWMDYYGSYNANAEKFPKGMKYIADLINDAGMIPGIWLAPFIMESTSPYAKENPDMFQRDESGEPVLYNCSPGGSYMIDPTVQKSLDYLAELFIRCKEWGFRYFKLDWLRAIYEWSNVRFNERTVNRAMAYEIAFTHIKKVLGEGCYILGCGGLPDPGNMNLANGNRSSKDVRGSWTGPSDVTKSGALIQIKQNLLRNYTNRFWDSDPDATQIRIRHFPFDEKETKCIGVYQSEGYYTDEEAFTVCAHQYLSGGLICISERFPELHEKRFAMLRHITPAVTPAARILDYDAPECPTLFLTDVHPRCEVLGDWWTLAVANWQDYMVKREITIGDIFLLKSNSEKFSVFEFHSQKFMGIYGKGDVISIEVPIHGIRVLRIAPWDVRNPKILGTDMHITGGAYEIAECNITDRLITGKVDRNWQYPIVITAGFPADYGIKIAYTRVNTGQTDFILKCR